MTKVPWQTASVLLGSEIMMSCTSGPDGRRVVLRVKGWGEVPLSLGQLQALAHRAEMVFADMPDPADTLMSEGGGGTVKPDIHLALEGGKA